MLSSITPLGERSRNRRWATTATAYVIAAVSGGAALGVVAGLLALVAAAVPATPRWIAATALALLLLWSERRRRLPSWQRQVDVAWLDIYRGWVTGVGYGAQLGLAFVTIVPTATTWLMLVVAVASGSFNVAVVIGAWFGLVRAVPVLAARQVATPAALSQLHQRLDTWARPADVAARSAALVVTAGVLALAIGAAS